jgi:hypothetical protein
MLAPTLGAACGAHLLSLLLPQKTFLADCADAKVAAMPEDDIAYSLIADQAVCGPLYGDCVVWLLANVSLNLHWGRRRHLCSPLADLF